MTEGPPGRRPCPVTARLWVVPGDPLRGILPTVLSPQDREAVPDEPAGIPFVDTP
jgi:hypothetical protein